jgi:hypothetical protein
MIDETDHTALCEAIVRETEISGSEVFEKNYIQDDKILATVFCFVGEHAEELTAFVREQLHKLGMSRDNIKTEPHD